MKNIIIQDVCETFVENLDTKKTHFFGLTESNEVNQKIDQTPLRGGIGNGIFATLQTNKEITFTTTTSTHDDEIYAIQSGGDFTSGQYMVPKQETKKYATSGVTLKGTPVGDTVLVIDKNGKTMTATLTTGKVTITDGVEGEIYTIIYSENVTGEILDLNSEVFPKNHRVTLHTIGYDPDTNAVMCDIYWVFEKCLPNGEIGANYKGGDLQTDTITFTAQLPLGEKSYGKYIVVPRV